MAAHHESETYRQVEITPQLQHRPAPRRDETRVLLMLAQAIAEQPDQSLQLLADCAMRVTSADSAGISIADVERNEEVFRWVATAGRFGPYLHTTLPRWFSPCGDTLRTGGVMLMCEPARHYPYIASLASRSPRCCSRRSGATANWWAPCGPSCTATASASTRKTPACSPA
jgi:hypothetical protein